MRDGVQLAAYVTVPADADGNAIDTPLPVVLVQTSYNGAAGSVVSAIGGADPYITAHGYVTVTVDVRGTGQRSEEHTSELQSLMRISYAVLCLKKKNNIHTQYTIDET